MSDNVFGITPPKPERDEGVEDLPNDLLEAAEEDFVVEEPEAEDEQDSTDPDGYIEGDGPFIASEDDEEAEEEGEEEEEDEYSAMLRRAVEREQPKSEEGEEEKDFDLGVKIGEQTSEVKAKLAAVEAELEALKQGKEEAKPEEVDPRDVAIDMSDPRVIQEIEKRKDDPVELAKFLKAVSDHEAQRLVRAELGPLKEQADKSKEVAETQELRAKLGAEVSAGLQAAFEMGGLEKAIVENYADGGDNSLLVQYLKANPGTDLSARGILSAVMTIARGVERSEQEAQEQGDDSPKPKLVSKNRPTTASNRGRKVIQKQKARKSGNSGKSPEDEIRNSIRNAKPGSQRLPFMTD